MKSFVKAGLLVIGMLSLTAGSGYAWDQGRGGMHGGFHGGFQSTVVVGHPGFHGVFNGRSHGGFHRGVRSEVFVGLGPFWWGPPWWYTPPYYAAPPMVVVEEQPPVYIQQQAPSPTATPEVYWYYCPDSKAYYPTVETCSEAWLKVPGRTPQ